jgi:hypothetical protein
VTEPVVEKPDFPPEPKAYDWRMGRRQAVPEAVRTRVLGLDQAGQGSLIGLALPMGRKQQVATPTPVRLGAARMERTTASKQCCFGAKAADSRRRGSLRNRPHQGPRADGRKDALAIKVVQLERAAIP